MALHITSACINCGACAIECPNTAIYRQAESWRMSDGTKLAHVLAEAAQLMPPISDDFFFIVADKCTECVGFFDEPQCAAVCPVDCCLIDPNEMETPEDLLKKQRYLHQL